MWRVSEGFSPWAEALSGVELIVIGLRQAAEMVRTAAMGRRPDYFGETSIPSGDLAAAAIPAELYALAGRIESNARQVLAREQCNVSLIERIGPVADAEDSCKRESADAATAIALTLPEVGTYVPAPGGMSAADRADTLRSAAAILRCLGNSLQDTVFGPWVPTGDFDDFADRLAAIAAGIE